VKIAIRKEVGGIKRERERTGFAKKREEKEIISS